jgi:hypothetical protein
MKSLRNCLPSTVDVHGPCDLFQALPDPGGRLRGRPQILGNHDALLRGKYEHYFQKEKARIVLTPDEHDLMMEQSSLDIIVPEIRKALQL